MYRLSRGNLIILIVFKTFIASVYGNWWRLGIENSENYKNISKSILTNKFDHFTFLSESQKKFFTQNTELFMIVLEGTKSSIEECQFQFKNHRWNCTIHPENERNLFGNYFTIYNSRESAFLHAISTVGVIHAITKACSKGNLMNCPCVNRRSRASVSWKWGDCSDDITYGEKFSKMFIDSIEDSTADSGIVNLHNNEAGRKLLKASMQKVCKCHGLSGSCSMKVCWKRLPPLRTLGDTLLNKYEGATQVMAVKRKRNQTKRLKPVNSELKKPTKMDLVFLNESANFCEQNVNYSILGTSGRVCSPKSYGIDGCSILCCGRGYQTRVTDIEEKCKCRFIWCCHVQCDICRDRIDENICN